MKEGLTKVEFAGRPSLGLLVEISFGKDSTDIVFADFGREWEVLRKVAHSAVRKFAVNERLPAIVDDQVRTFLAEIEEQNGTNPFDPNDYVSFLMMSLLATSAFGKKFTMSDPEFRLMNEANKLLTETGNRALLISFLPFLRHVFRREYQSILDTIELRRDFATREYKEHLQTYCESDIRDFTDAMIFAKKKLKMTTRMIRNI